MNILFVLIEEILKTKIDVQFLMKKKITMLVFLEIPKIRRIHV